MRVALLVTALVAISCGDAQQEASSRSLPSTALAEIQSELDGWAEGRWQSVNVSGDIATGRVIIEIEISPQANSVAQESYCRIVRNAVVPHLDPGHSWSASLRVSGQVVRSCP